MIFDSGLNDITEQDFNNCYLDFIKDLHNVRIGVVGKDNVDKRKGTDEL